MTRVGEVGLRGLTDRHKVISKYTPGLRVLRLQSDDLEEGFEGSVALAVCSQSPRMLQRGVDRACGCPCLAHEAECYPKGSG